MREVSDMRSSNGVRALALFSAAALVCWATPARGDAKVDKKLATELGREVLQSAHPMAKDISLLEHKEATKDGHLVLSIKMRYFGKVTSAKYTADVTITLDPGKEPPKVLNVDYKDDNRIPASKAGLKDVREKVAKLLPKKL
jgi:hypothetical protein